MKVLLVAPPEKHMLRPPLPKELDKESGFKPPLGILYIASYLREHSDHEVSVLDMPVEGMSAEDITRIINERQPDIVGITTTTFTLIDVLLVAQIVKKIDASIYVCLGGPHVDIYPIETMRLPNVDFAIRGEGEMAFLDLVNALESGQSLRSVKNLVFKEDGKVIINRRRPRITDLDSLPFPARELTPWQKYSSVLSSHRPITHLLTQKGCPYNCIFCYRHAGKRLYQRSPKSIVDEMEQCQRLGIKEIMIVDDTFTVPPRRVLDICSEILARGLRIAWDARARVDNLTEELIVIMKEAGCQKLYIGVEAGTNKSLRTLRKNITLEQIRRAFKITRRVGMTTVGYFMIASPGETKEDVLRTIEFACELEPDYAEFTRTTLFPATEMYTLALKSGLLTRDCWREFAENPHPHFIPPLWTEHLSNEEINELLKRAYQRFYFRPKYILEQARRTRSLDEFKSKVKAGITLAIGW